MIIFDRTCYNERGVDFGFGEKEYIHIYDLKPKFIPSTICKLGHYRNKRTSGLEGTRTKQDKEEDIFLSSHMTNSASWLEASHVHM